ncbi:uncharacterized protein G2W53_040732 [Senna tora]|uniref:Helitron helicase-like domain-containing protein n=1 Tax=Senna tora TaxID=362788 RepID=A0A834W0R6_9FABA|nr:uncharacterized protein G2W53_040732 [Senna tora]
MLVSEPEELRGASGVKLTATVLEDGEDRRVLADGIGFILGEQSREAMEDSVVHVEDAGWFGELGGVPVVVGGENRSVEKEETRRSRSFTQSRAAARLCFLLLRPSSASTFFSFLLRPSSCPLKLSHRHCHSRKSSSPELLRALPFASQPQNRLKSALEQLEANNQISHGGKIGNTEELLPCECTATNLRDDGETELCFLLFPPTSLSSRDRAPLPVISSGKTELFWRASTTKSGKGHIRHLPFLSLCPALCLMECCIPFLYGFRLTNVGEDDSLRFSSVRFHQKKLRSENYITLTEALSKGQVPSSSVGKRIILPSSFIGGERYSRENFQDAMTICTTTGFLDLFITFTCNPRLMRDITEDILFGTCRAAIYTIEFHKRGMPHAHILFWLAPEDKFTSTTQTDSVIFAEIPNPNAHLALFNAVKNFMIYGPCGASRKSSPCMANGKCSKHFLKRFIDRTSFDEDGYARYRRRESGNAVIKNGVELDNRFVVPYNLRLLLRYQAHINVEFCNQTRSIKYLFKNVSKGHYKVTVAICKAKSSEDDDPIDDVVGNASLKQTKFLDWLEANRIRATAKELTYAQFPTKFVLKTDTREWCSRKASYAIGRLYYVPPSDACYAMGFLDDDKEYIDGINDDSKWSSRVYLRNLFSTLLIHNTIAIPSAVWEQTWMHLSNDILIKERYRLCNPVNA